MSKNLKAIQQAYEANGIALCSYAQLGTKTMQAWLSKNGIQALAIDRGSGSKYGNPFVHTWRDTEEHRQFICDKYEQTVLPKFSQAELQADLVGKMLVCHCTQPNVRCHGQSLIDKILS